MKDNSKKIMTAKKVNHEYTVESTYKAGLVLKGWMIKSIRAGHINASGVPFVTIQNSESFLHGLTISPIKNTDMSHTIDTDSPIKLLLQKREIGKLLSQQQQQGYTLVVRQLFWEGSYVKAELCVAKGKKLHDKRASIKERDDKRQAQRTLKNAKHSA